MDKLLARRYEVLIENRQTITPWVKELVLSKAEQHPTLVRPDAAFFLIVTMDEMIVLPYAGPIRPWPFSEFGSTHYRNYSINNLKPRVAEALDILFLDLKNVDEVSAHQVLRAIDKNWPQLTVLFGWG
ncbi:MAG: hypothetical protein WAL47_02235 [Pyrinomonadaceae bacterium]